MRIPTAYTTSCKICKREFSTIPSKKKIYCSFECYTVARTRGFYPAYWQGKKHPHTSSKQGFQKGVRVWCEGKQLSPEHRKKLSLAKMGKYIGMNHPNWQGGRRLDEKGYVRIWISKKHWRYEHRLVMEKTLGRPLKRGEIVHHINQNKTDNRLENLMLFVNNKAHMEYHRNVLEMPIINQYS